MLVEILENNEAKDGLYGKNIGIAEVVNTRKSKTKATTIALTSILMGDDQEIRLQTEIHRIDIVRRVLDPPGYRDPDMSDQLLTRLDWTAIQSSQTYKLPLYPYDIIPLLLGDQPDVVEAQAGLAFLVRLTSIERVNDFDSAWDRVLAMLIQRSKMDKPSDSLWSTYLAKIRTIRQ